MKRLFTVLLGVFLVIGLYGCAGKNKIDRFDLSPDQKSFTITLKEFESFSSNKLSNYFAGTPTFVQVDESSIYEASMINNMKIQVNVLIDTQLIDSIKVIANFDDNRLDADKAIAEIMDIFATALYDQNAKTLYESKLVNKMDSDAMITSESMVSDYVLYTLRQELHSFYESTIDLTLEPTNIANQEEYEVFLITESKNAIEEEKQAKEDEKKAEEETKKAEKEEEKAQEEAQKAEEEAKKEKAAEEKKKKENTPTLGQSNALDKAYSYLEYSSFSYSGLVDQLKYEGFSASEAKYAVDRCGADWNEQAAKKAKSYMEYSSFSKQGLIEQLLYEGFSQSQSNYGAKSVGY